MCPAVVYFDTSHIAASLLHWIVLICVAAAFVLHGTVLATIWALSVVLTYAQDKLRRKVYVKCVLECTLPQNSTAACMH